MLRTGARIFLHRTGALTLFGDLAAVDQSAFGQVGRHSLSETPACRHSEFSFWLGRTACAKQPSCDRTRAWELQVPTERKPSRSSRPVPIADDDRKDHFVVRNGVRCAGVHLIVDLYDAKHLDNIDLHRRGAAPLRRRRGRDAAAHPPASLRAERRGLRRRGAGREPHLDPHLAGGELRRARRVHVRRGQARGLHPGAARGVQAEAHRGRRASARAGRRKPVPSTVHRPRMPGRS